MIDLQDADSIINAINTLSTIISGLTGVKSSLKLSAGYVHSETNIRGDVFEDYFIYGGEVYHVEDEVVSDEKDCCAECDLEDIACDLAICISEGRSDNRDIIWKKTDITVAELDSKRMEALKLKHD
jgi:hypothetical protein